MMADTAAALYRLIQAADAAIRSKAEEVTALDQAIGDGDHVYNLQRGIEALLAHADDFARLDWAEAFKKMGMLVMTTVGGASGSLYGTFFLSLGKTLQGSDMKLGTFAPAFALAVDAIKARGKADLGEKTMLDVLIPVAHALSDGAAQGKPLAVVLPEICAVAEAGVEATRDLVATKGRASFLGERARGHIDAGAKTSQLMIQAVAEVLSSPER
jgi:dihydroxyacetone kinase-like protein